MARAANGLILVFAVWITGCVPVAHEYFLLKPEVGSATYIKDVCREYGPPSIVQYQIGHLRYEVTLSEDYYKGFGANLELRAPVSSTVDVLDRTVLLVDSSGRVTTLNLEARDILSPDGRLTSSREARQGLFLYRLAFSPHMTFPEKGSIRLPAFRIDNVMTPSHEIKFERKWYAGFLPLNC